MRSQTNILVIHADQHRIDCLGPYGNPDVQTPHIDSLAADGVVYNESFCTFPVCTPSRYSLLTGVSVRQHGGYTNQSNLPLALPTFAEILGNAGYRTKAVGKMHLNPTYLDVGFNELLLAEQNGLGRLDDDYHRWLRDEGLVDRIDLMSEVPEFREDGPQEYYENHSALESDLDDAHHSTTWIGDRALETLESWDEGAHVLMVGFIKPHHPYDPPASWSGMYAPEDLTLLPGWTTEAQPRDLEYHTGTHPHRNLTEKLLRQAMAYYYALVSQIDFHVGRMIDCLKRKGLYDDTLILYTSDHGDYQGFHHMVGKLNYMYDPLAKVPLIIKYPDQALAGETSDGLVSNIDVAPTILRAAGSDVPDTMKGFDLIQKSEGQRELVFTEAKAGEHLMVRSHTRKLLLCKDDSQSLFFDLVNDPMELNNLYEDPAHRQGVEEYTHAGTEWLESQHTVVDEPDQRRPLVRGANVPALDDGHREDMLEYFRREMKGG